MPEADPNDSEGTGLERTGHALVEAARAFSVATRGKERALRDPDGRINAFLKIVRALDFRLPEAEIRRVRGRVVLEALAFGPFGAEMLPAQEHVMAAVDALNGAIETYRAALPAPGEDGPAPATLGPWTVDGTIGAGAQAVAYRVHRPDDPERRPFVAKVLKRWTEASKSPSEAHQRGRFQREVSTLKTLAASGCPGIVTVEDDRLAMDSAEQPWYVMPLYAGGALADAKGDAGLFVATRLRGDVARVLEIAEHLASTLAWMHGQTRPIPHRDVHTGNVFLETPDGPPVLGDFGLVHDPTGTTGPPTGTGESLGPWQWRPPEFEPGPGAKDSPKSDVFLLGGVIYECLSGGKCIARPERPDGTFAHEHPPFALAQFSDDPRIPHVSTLLRHMLADSPDARLSAKDVGAACARLRTWVAGMPAPRLDAGVERLARATAAFHQRSEALRGEAVVRELAPRCDRIARSFGLGEGESPYKPWRNVEVNYGDLHAFGRAKAEVPTADWVAIRVLVRIGPRPSLSRMSYVFLGRARDGREVVATHSHANEWRVLSESFAGDPAHDALLAAAAAAALADHTEWMAGELERAR